VAGTTGTGGNAGATGTGGNAGATGTGGTSGATGTAGSGGTNASCDPGTTTTTWASNCATAPATTCVTGTWTDPGSTTNDPLQCSTDHFAVHAPAGTITAQQCMNATTELETVIWPNLFGSPIFFPEPYCNTANKFKASVVIHSDYGLTGGGWGNGFMGMWVGPGATADHWGLAHEFMHAVQSTTRGLNCGRGPNTCGWIYESHANWRSQQLPEYHTSNVHCSELSVNVPHLYMGSTRVRYCDWQFMEYLKDKFCYQAVNDIWTAPTASADPFTNIMSTRGWNISQLNDFFGEWAMHNVTWDYRDPAPESTAGGNQGALFRSNYGLITDRTGKSERRNRIVTLDPLDGSFATNRRFVSPDGWAPQRWGYNIIRLFPDAGATSVTVTFRGVIQSGANPDFRWGLVATDSGVTTPRYSALQRGTDGQLSFCVNAGESLFLVIMATPSVQQQVVWDQLYNTVYRYPYMIQLGNAWPDGWQGGTQAACATGLVRHANGGGCAPSALAASVFVGPYATVLSGPTVSGNAVITDHATILNGTVSGGTVGGLTILGSKTPGNANTFTLSGSAVAKTTFYPLGFFEPTQSISGTAALVGDVEYRGASMTETAGTFYGFVDNTITAATNTTDITIPPPYTWRP
jgi:hypothetical protein